MTVKHTHNRINPPLPSPVNPFNMKWRQAADYQERLMELHQCLLDTLGEENVKLRAEMEALAVAFNKVALEVKTGLEKPRLVLAAAGTTSSAKSTLANFVSGADLMPTAVGEMSAGVVKISHAATSKLEILPTEGAIWECKTYNGLSAEQIKRRLTEIMKTFHDIVERARDDESIIVPAAPQVRLEYPLRADLHERLGVPPEIEIEIRDLPGIKSLSDSTNLKELKACEQALILLAFDAREPDKKKQEELLAELVRLVEELQGSPDRLFFFASRVDVFRQNHPNEWPGNENAYIAHLWQRIKHAIIKRRENYTGALNRMHLFKLCPQPAFLAHQIRTGQPLDDTLRRDLRGYGFLFPLEMSSDLPRNATSAEREQYLDVLEQASYAPQFFSGLKDRIEKRIFRLIIDPLIGAYIRDGAVPYVTAARQIIQTQIDAANENYDQAIAELDNIEVALKALLSEMEAQLKTPFETLRTKMQQQRATEPSKREVDIGQLFDELHTELSEIETYKAIKRELTPLSQWDANIKGAVQDLLEYCVESLNGNPVAPPACTKPLAERHLLEFDYACRELRQAGYADFARRGKTFVKEDNPQTVHRLNKALNVFDSAVTEWVNALLEDQFRLQHEFAYSALDCLFQRHSDAVSQRAEDISKKIGFYTLPYSLNREVAVHSRGIRPLEGGTSEQSTVQTGQREEDYTEHIPIIIFGRKIFTIKIPWKRIIRTERHVTENTFPSTEAMKSTWQRELDKQSVIVLRSSLETFVIG